MSEDRRVTISSSSPLSPDEVARRTFATARRGYAAEEVRGYLETVAQTLRAASEREQELRQALDDAEERAAHPVIDEETLTEALGRETARVLHSAHEAAAEMVAKAKEESERLLSASAEEIAATEAKVGTQLAERTARAESAATELRRRAQEESAAAVEAARIEVESMLAQARVDCREMVEEAQALRSRVLADLSKRRKVFHAQIDQLRAGREHLAETVRGVRRSIDAIADDLFRAEDEARLAAEAAGRVAAARPDEGGPDELDGPDVTGTVVVTDEIIVVEDLAVEDGGTGEGIGLGGVVGDTTPEQVEIAEIVVADERVVADTAPEQVEAAEIVVADERVVADTAPEQVEADDGLPAPATDERPAQPATESGVGGDPGGPGTGAHDVEGVPGGTVPGGTEAAASRDDRPLDLVAGTITTPPAGAADAEESSVDALFAKLRASHAGAGAGAVEHDGSEETGDQGAGGDGPPGSRHPSAVRRDEMITPIVTRLSRRLKRTLQDDQNDVLDSLRSAHFRWTPDVLPPEPEHHDSYATAVLPYLEEAAQAGREFVGSGTAEEGGGSLPPDVLALANELAAHVADPLRRRLGDTGRLEGADEGTVAEHVGSAFREWKGERVERLAGDFVIKAFSAGSISEATGGGGAAPTPVEWLAVADPGKDPCADCEDNALAGPQAAGEPFPTGHLFPPAHPGCRCLLLPAGT